MVWGGGLMVWAAEEAGREVFLGFSALSKGLFYGLAALAIATFLGGFFIRARKYAKGRPAGRVSLRSILSGLEKVATQRTVAKGDPYVGVAHFFVFWGFIVLLIGTTIIAIDEDVIGLALGKPEWQFWKGAFYVVYALAMDVFGIGFIVGLLMLAARRRRRPFRLDYRRVDLAEGEYDRRG